MMAEISRGTKCLQDSGQKVRCFEDLHVYARARELTKQVYDVTRRTGFSRDFPLRDQIRRAVVSVMSNIAEGFERSSNAEFVQFLYIAKGSCAEVRAQLTVALDQEYIQPSVHQSLHDMCRRTSAMVSNLIACLKTASSAGTKRRQSASRSPKETSDAL